MVILNIRKANVEDIPQIYDLINELALFENESNAVKISVEEFADAFKDKIIGSIVALDNETIVGITIFYMTFSTWRGRCLYLEDFYVKADYRRHKLGQKLFDAYLEEAIAQRCNQAKWQVLDWNEIGINFYTKNNVSFEKNWWNCKIYF